MAFLQAVLGGLFTILGAGSLFFIAYKAMMIGNDVTEMKDLLRNMQRGGNTGPNVAPAAVGAINSAYTPPPLETPVEAYDEPTPVVVKPAKEFVLPPPISRRLDAERGIRRSSNDDARVRS